MVMAAGAILAGRYRLERKLGAGGMGEVWAARNIAVGTDVALKTMHATASSDAELVMRFRREAFLLARIKNDHVSRVLDFANDENFGLVLVMDLIEGPSLADVLKQKRLSVEEAIDLGADILRGMASLHRANVVHRDLKPGNVILEPRPGGRPKAVIVDFGLGRLMAAQGEEHDTSGLTRADMAVGTMEYMSPEQILNSRGVTGSADIYALAAMLYRAVAGVHIFGDLTNLKLAQAKLTTDAPPLITGRTDAVAKYFETVVKRGIKRRPQERYATAEEMLVDLTMGGRAGGGSFEARMLEDDEEKTVMQSSADLAAMARGAAQAASPSSERARMSGTHPMMHSPPAAPPIAASTGALATTGTTGTNGKKSGSGGAVAMAFFALLLGVALGAGVTLHRLRIGIRGLLASPPPANAVEAEKP
jgi:serine/threonine protein kinase